MNVSSHHAVTPTIRAVFAILLSVIIFAGCSATTKPQRKTANIEIYDAVGFTITEEVHVSDADRLKYDEALRVLREGSLDRGIAILEEVAEAAPLVTARSRSCFSSTTRGSWRG